MKQAELLERVNKLAADTALLHEAAGAVCAGLKERAQAQDVISGDVEKVASAIGELRADIQQLAAAAAGDAIDDDDQDDDDQDDDEADDEPARPARKTSSRPKSKKRR